MAGCSASYGRSHHDYPATDIFASRGCPFGSPVAGHVDEVSTVDRWDRVPIAAVGRVGNSGDARGIATHLHFGISWPTASGVWWVRRGEVYPWPYLDAWRSDSALSPVAAVDAVRARLGTVPRCSVDC